MTIRRWGLQAARVAMTLAVLGSGACVRRTSLGDDAAVVADGPANPPDADDHADRGDGAVDALCEGTPCDVSCSSARPCPAGAACCAGACVDTAADPSHCGGCGAVCTTPEAIAACAGGRCAVATCRDGFGDCDGRAASGCELDLRNDPSNCGSCGRVCVEGEYCHTGGGATRCTPVAPPRLIAPLSTATVTSRRPTLRWERRGRDSSVRVDLCLDRDCSRPVMAFDASGDRGAPPSELPSGVIFWRVRDRALGAPSTTWQFTVGARSAAVDTSWGSVADFNGDGYADLAVGAGSAEVAGVFLAGRAHVYYGSARGLPSAPSWSVDSPDGRQGRFGEAIANAGDLNGDGYADLAVGARSSRAAGLALAGRVHVYFGSATGLPATASENLDGPDGVGGFFGAALAGAGDVNGDGYADLVVGAPFASGPDGRDISGRAHVYLGGEAGLASTPSQDVDGAGGQWAEAVVGAGDVNGDGFADVAITGRGTDVSGAEGPGRVAVFLGGELGLKATADWLVEGRDGPDGGFGVGLAAAGDLNGDGYADLAIGAPGAAVSGMRDAGRAYVHLGGPSGLSVTPARVLEGRGWDHRLGRHLAGIGDANRDGFADLAVVEASGRLWIAGSTRVYVGGPEGPGSVAAQEIVSSYGCPDPRSGDVNGDGYLDLILGSPWASPNDTYESGAVYVHFGAATGFAQDGSQSVDGPDGRSSGFGGAIASATRARRRWSCVRRRELTDG